MKRGGSLHPTRPNWWPPTKRPWTTLGGLIAASIGLVPSPEFLAYPVPKTYRRRRIALVLGFRAAWVSRSPP